MAKPLLGVLLGSIFGLLDGLSAYRYPEVRTMMMSIIAGSTGKGLVAGLICGLVARKYNSILLGLVVGGTVGLVLGYVAAALSPDPQGNFHYAQIMLPGMALGMIVGFATQRFGRRSLEAGRPA